MRVKIAMAAGDAGDAWCLHAQCGVQRGLGVVESQQAGLGLLYIRAVLSYCLLLWSYRDIYFELSSFG